MGENLGNDHHAAYRRRPKAIIGLGFRGRRDIGTDGLRYFRLRGNPQTQMLVARLVKGIIPIADVVRKGRRYHAAELDLEQTRAIAEDEFYAGDAVLCDLFDDFDRHSENRFFSFSRSKGVLFDTEMAGSSGLHICAPSFSLWSSRNGPNPRLEHYIRMLQEIRARVEGTAQWQGFLEVSISDAATDQRGVVRLDKLFFMKGLPENARTVEYLRTLLLKRIDKLLRVAHEKSKRI